MVKTWKKSETEINREGNIMEAGLAAIEEMEGAVPSGWETVPLSELRKEPASKFVKTEQRWCPKFIAESYSRSNLDKEKNKNYFKLVLDAINDNYVGPFDVNDVISWINGIDISEGTLQRKILSWMVCLGILEMNHIKIKKNGKEKPKYVFVKTINITPCPNLTSGECKFDWKQGSITNYFPPEYRKSSEEELEG